LSVIGWLNKLGETIASLAFDRAQTEHDRGLLSARLGVSVSLVAILAQHTASTASRKNIGIFFLDKRL
jgi:hypothetical protein